jgi:protein-tyrosine kinase
MNRLFSAIRKARQAGNRDAAPEQQVADPRAEALAVAGDHRDRRGRTNRRARKRRADSSIDERLVAFHSTNASAAEQYRKLSVEIARMGRVRELRTLLIVSALENEGKTLTALNLAITMAASGDEQVLLVETDFRKPRVHHLLGTRPACGLSDYLLGDIAYAQMVMQTPIPGLAVVYAGRRVKNPTALLSSEKMGQFLQHVKLQTPYRYVVLDATPILLTSEPMALMQYVDAALLVVRAKKTSRDVVLQAIEALGEEHILGCVLNGMTATDAYNYRYYYYSDYYHPNGNTPH